MMRMIGYNWLVYGEGGTGKSYLAVSAPGRKLLIDAEGRTDNLPGEVVFWNGQSTFPECSENAIVVLPCKDGQSFAKIVGALKSNKIPVDSVIVDSVTMMQLNEIDDRFDGMPTTQQAWGQVLKTFAPAMQQLLRLTKDDKHRIDCVVLLAWHRETGQYPDVRITPDIVGQLNRRLSHLNDVTGYLKVRGTGAKSQRILQITPVNNITAKSTYSALDKYNGFIPNPNITIQNNEMRQSNA
jgi:hypothetical protein